MILNFLPTIFNHLTKRDPLITRTINFRTMHSLNPRFLIDLALNDLNKMIRIK